MAAADSCDGISTSGGGGGGREKTVTLVTSDDARFEVREAAASLSQTLRRVIDEAGGGDGGIPIPKVDARTLSTVLGYCNKHAPAPESSSAEAGAVDLEWFDKKLMHVDMATLRSLIRAADYLKVAGLLNLACKTVADMIKGKTPEEIMQMLGLQNDDFTPEEEEEQLRRENA